MAERLTFAIHERGGRFEAYVDFDPSGREIFWLPTAGDAAYFAARAIARGGELYHCPPRLSADLVAATARETAADSVRLDVSPALVRGGVEWFVFFAVDFEPPHIAATLPSFHAAAKLAECIADAAPCAVQRYTATIHYLPAAGARHG